jgi:rod shape determining protein RodA
MLKSLDYTLIIVVSALVLFGLVAIGSATLEFTGDSFSRLQDTNVLVRFLYLDYTYILKQLTWFLIGIVFMGVIIYIPYEDLLKHTRLLYIFNLFILGAVLVTGHMAYGAQRWIDVGPFAFQPSEFSKVLMIITFTGFLVKRQGNLARVRDLFPCFIYVGIPVILVLKQPDLGTSLVFIAVMFSMLFFAGARSSILLGTLGAGMALVAGLFLAHMYLHDLDLQGKEQLAALERERQVATEHLRRQELDEKYQQLSEKYKKARELHEEYHNYTLKEYQMTRLLIFLNPNSDLLGAGYHIWQSLIAIGSGGLAGKGLLGGTQSHLTFLPVRHTDFIFSVVGEEFGFLGTLVLLGLFLVIITRGIGIALDARDLTGTLLAMGVVSMFAFHVFVNVGMTTGIMPVAGIPLPFFSYGGSNMIMSMMAMGLLLNVHVRRRKILF